MILTGKKTLKKNRFQKGWRGLDQSEKINYVRLVPLIILHLSVFLVFFVRITLACLVLGLVLYVVRMFVITIVTLVIKLSKLLK